MPHLRPVATNPRPAEQMTYSITFPTNRHTQHVGASDLTRVTQNIDTLDSQRLCLQSAKLYLVARTPPEQRRLQVAHEGLHGSHDALRFPRGAGGVDDVHFLTPIFPDGVRPGLQNIVCKKSAKSPQELWQQKLCKKSKLVCNMWNFPGETDNFWNFGDFLQTFCNTLQTFCRLFADFLQTFCTGIAHREYRRQHFFVGV